MQSGCHKYYYPFQCEYSSIVWQNVPMISTAKIQNMTALVNSLQCSYDTCHDLACTYQYMDGCFSVKWWLLSKKSKKMLEFYLFPIIEITITVSMVFKPVFYGFVFRRHLTVEMTARNTIQLRCMKMGENSMLWSCTIHWDQNTEFQRYVYKSFLRVDVYLIDLVLVYLALWYCAFCRGGMLYCIITYLLPQ